MNRVKTLLVDKEKLIIEVEGVNETFNIPIEDYKPSMLLLNFNRLKNNNIDSTIIEGVEPLINLYGFNIYLIDGEIYMNTAEFREVVKVPIQNFIYLPYEVKYGYQ